MGKRLFLLTVAVVIVYSSAVFALDAMGPAASELKQGKFNTGIEFSSSWIDLRLDQGKYFDGISWSDLASVNIDSEVFKLFVLFGYGITDNVEAFLRFDAANINFEGDTPMGPSATFNGQHGCAIGFGTKATFYQTDNLKLGGLFQVSWSNSEGKMKTDTETWKLDLELIEYQFAVGPIYKLMDGVSIYGGPFLHFVDGDVDGKRTSPSNTRKLSWDIDERSRFGGYIGTQINIIKNAPFYIEYQHTAHADALGMYMTLVLGP